MPFFNQDKSENSNYSTYSSTPEQNFPTNIYSGIKEDDEYYNCSIKFKGELSNGSLIFLIVDDDYNHAGGYVVVSPSGIPTIIDDKLYEIDDSDFKHIKSLAKAFFDATKK